MNFKEMKSIALFVLFLCATDAFDVHGYYKPQQKNVNPAKPDQKFSPRIVNGEEANRNQFPFMVVLKPKDMEGKYVWCGGGLLNNQWIITAAHCLYRKKSTIVYIGSNAKAEASEKFVVKRNKMVVHPYYNESNFYYNDIALINIPFKSYTPSIQHIALPSLNYSPNWGSIAFIPGWGRNSTNGTVSPILMYARLKIISNQNCREYFPHIDDTKLCASSIQGGICFGDSGGPLVQVASQNYVAIGIASFFHQDGCLIGTPDGFTRITPYLNWIHHITRI